ncbi:MAG: hypothetical protein ACM3ZE_07320 [Myxococcales bacterium]
MRSGDIWLTIFRFRMIRPLTSFGTRFVDATHFADATHFVDATRFADATHFADATRE